MTKKLNKLKKDTVSRYLKGHKYTNKIQAIERGKRLNKLSVKESLQEYNDLCDLWYSKRQPINMDLLNKRKIAFLMERRKKFDLIHVSRSKK